MSTVIGWWDPDEFAGTPKSAMCATPKCGHFVGGPDGKSNGGRGLCSTCYRMWHRYGIEGLLRRAARLARGEENFHAPFTIPECIKQIRACAAEYETLDTSKKADVAAARIDRKIIKLAQRLGQIKQRKAQKEAHDRYKAKFIKERGIEEWKKKDRERKIRYHENKEKDYRGIHEPRSA